MLDQKLLQQQHQNLSPQQIQVIKMLEIRTMELDVRIKDEIEANPALEEVGESSSDEQEKNQTDNSKTSENGLEGDDFVLK